MRPRTAYTMELIYWWARLASHAPWLLNIPAQTPLLSTITKAAGGISQKRRVPKFAPETFRSWSGKRPPVHTGRKQVMLFPDTFNNHFFPETAQAATEVLEAAGFRVDIPLRVLCCARPMYDWGMLSGATKVLRQMLDTLHRWIAEGVPMVVLEPSCLATFRDELPNLFPGDHDATRLSSQTFLLSEFLQKEAKDFDIPKLHGSALVHGHCHHKSLIGMADEEAVLKRLGLDYEMPDTGCCGMAGAFGFESQHYDVSTAAGERVLLPAVRNTAHDAFVIADGFSCREQIAQTTDRRALHLADVLRMAIDRRAPIVHTDGRTPEQAIHEASLPSRGRANVLAGVATTVALAGAGAIVWAQRRRITRATRAS